MPAAGTAPSGKQLQATFRGYFAVSSPSLVVTAGSTGNELAIDDDAALALRDRPHPSLDSQGSEDEPPVSGYGHGRLLTE